MVEDEHGNNEWFRRFCAGDEGAYKFFFEEYYPIFVHFAMKYLHDMEVCEDIVHDVVYEFYSKKRVFENINMMKSFFYLAVKNKCLNYLEHKKAEQNYLEELSRHQQKDFFLDSMIEEEVYLLMHRTIHEFPGMMRSVYELSLEGKSNDEIAEALGLSLDSVKGYKKRGKSILKDKLRRLMPCISPHQEHLFLDILGGKLNFPGEMLAWEQA